MLLLLQKFLVAQARGAWFSLVVTAGEFVFIRARRYREGLVCPPRPQTLHYAAVISVLVIFAATQRQMIFPGCLRRFLSYRTSFPGSRCITPNSLLALCWNAQRFGMEIWLRHPLTG